MTDTENFKKVIAVLIDAPKAWRLCLTCPGHWYVRKDNESKDQIVSNLVWAVKELVGKGDYAIAVWVSRPEVKEAWFEFHEDMARHYIVEMQMNNYEDEYPCDAHGLAQLQRELGEV